MAPGQLLRAILPIRSMSSPMTLIRPTILPSTSSLSQSIRSLSSTPIRSFEQPLSSLEQPLSTPQETSRDPEPVHLLRPAKLRDYAFRLKTGTVVSVGRMQRTVTVLHRHTTWDKQIRKYYPKETKYLVSDPRDSLREGDVIEFASGAPKSRRVHHVVERIITPFAVPIEDRPAVMTREERQAEREHRWADKHLRRESTRLGTDIDLVGLAQSPHYQSVFKGKKAPEDMSTPQLLRKLTKQRVGKVKALVRRRVGIESERRKRA